VESSKQIIIGLDAADYELTKKFMDSGKMPRLAAVRKSGNFSRLKSVIPPNTAPGWTSITTGMNPGKHGIFYFYDFAQIPLKIVNATNSSTPRIWDYIKAVGGRSVMVNVPVTYPVGEVSGSIVAGIPPWYLDERSVFPKGLQSKLECANYEIDAPLSRALEKRPEELVNRLMETERRRVKLFFELADEEKYMRFGMIVLTALDRLQHKLVGKGVAEDDAICRAYSEIDSLVGEILDKFSGANILVVSDHGFNFTPIAFYPNSWLYGKGLLRRRSSFGYRLTKFLHDLFDGHFLWVPKSATKRFQGATTVVRSIDAIDIEKSRAFVPGTDGVVFVKSKQDVDLVAAGLSELRDEDGQKICNVYGRDKVFTGDKVSSAPELLIVPRDDVNIRSDPFSEKFVTSSGVFPKGNHGPNGIFFATGPDVSTSKEMQLSLEDVAPTSLVLLGIKPDSNMDGRVVEEILAKSAGGALSSASVQLQDRAFKFSRSEEELVMDNLRRLGYT